MMEVKVCVSHFSTFLFGAISTVNVGKDFQRAAAPLSPMSGKVYINTEKHPENISFPIQSSRPPLNKRIGEVTGKGKIWFLTLAAERPS